MLFRSMETVHFINPFITLLNLFSIFLFFVDSRNYYSARYLAIPILFHPRLSLHLTLLFHPRLSLHLTLLFHPRLSLHLTVPFAVQKLFLSESLTHLRLSQRL